MQQYIWYIIIWDCVGIYTWRVHRYHYYYRLVCTTIFSCVSICDRNICNCISLCFTISEYHHTLLDSTPCFMHIWIYIHRETEYYIIYICIRANIHKERGRDCNILLYTTIYVCIYMYIFMFVYIIEAYYVTV